MDLSKMEEAGKNIETKLTKIRENLSAPIGNYQPRSAGIEISGKELRDMALQSPGEPIIIDGEILMAYIRDHTFQGYRRDYKQAIKSHPAHCFCFGNKVHFYQCPTLKQMEIKERMPRYRLERVFVNKHIIDISNKEKMSVRLALCKNCFNIFFSKAGMRTLPFNDISRMAEYGDAKKLMECVRSLYDNEPSAKENAEEFIHTYKHV